MSSSTWPFRQTGIDAASIGAFDAAALAVMGEPASARLSTPSKRSDASPLTVAPGRVPILAER